ncbi:MAG TPA: copper resistance protein CopC [Acidimicrobiia bacterium]|jgi:copper transport protein|nr:copper resistance protein CopC [Acidimicrobiia bacterium]
MIRRLLALGALVVALVVVAAAPASAHATLLTTDPQNGGVYDKPPSQVKLRFNEPVEVSLGGVRLFSSDRARVVTGSPEHPGGTQSEVAVSLPQLDDGTYVVTWRVISADSHPVEGAFTFQVGSKATLSKKSAQGVADSLLASTGGSKTVGVVYGIDRAVLFGALALLIGGVVFLVAVWPRGRDDRRAARVVWGGWIGVAVTTVLGIALEGVYAAGLPLSKVFDPTVFRDVLDTRYGKVALLRLALLVVAFPLLRLLLHRRPAAEHPVRAWWMVAAGLVGLGLAVTPGLGGHAGTGIQTGLAIPADMVHVAAMACWLGGLVVLCIAVLPRGDADELRAVLPRYSALALGAVVALIVSGGYQAWRQVGSIDALKSTDYGRLLIAKLVVFAALIVAAAFSREIVNRRFRDYPSDDELDDELDAEFVEESVPVGAGVSSGGGTAGSVPERPRRFDDDGYDGGWDDDTTDEEEVHRLRRSVAIEVVIAAVILSITALLVNAAPARSVETQPVSLTLKSSQVWVYVDIAPGIAGPNDMHFTSLPTGGGPATIDDMSVQLTRPGEDLPPFTVPLQKLGNGHYFAPLYDIPYSGKWQMTIRVQLGPTDEAVLVSPFSVR